MVYFASPIERLRDFLQNTQKINASCTMYIKVGWLEYQPFDKEGTLNLYFPLQPTCEGLSSSLERLIGEVARILRQKLSLMQTLAELIQSLTFALLVSLDKRILHIF